VTPTDAVPEHDVHLWTLFSDAVADAALLDQYASWLAPEERARHDRFVFAKDRRQFLITRGMIRSLVASYLAADPAACAFESDRYGRPSLTQPPGSGFAFNLSHTAGLIVCAIAREPEIGVDAEDASRGVDPELHRRFFSPAEADALDALPEAERPSRFFEYWTLKEAYIKARGMGLSLPLDGFSMDLRSDRPPCITFTSAIDDAAETWQFAQVRPGPRHYVALAVRRSAARDRAIHLREFPASGLSRV
jgi:4'-phosphopantetheinyl transferase